MEQQSGSFQGRQGHSTSRSLAILDPTKPHTFIKPVKKINEGHDVPHFLTSKAYVDIGKFVMQLNIAMCPRKSDGTGIAKTWALDSDISLPEPVRQLQELLQSIDSIIEEAPPDTGPRRFGNVSFRKWYEILESRVEGLLQTHLPASVLSFGSNSDEDPSAIDELKSYLMGGFGSSQRLDYGTGHELSFLAFLGCIWKLGGFAKEQQEDGALERSIVLAVIEPYFRVIRRLILTYTLEPAGSHGVWGLDDHSFLPYILGSSQYCPAINDDEAMPVEGSLENSPNPADVAKKTVVNRERKHNMYFSAVGFINDVKTGPFWEHSPILFDISGVRSGWGKINKGMIKMYNAEVLSKFPVVQHFPFGSLFRWEQDPNAAPVPTSIHTASQPPRVSESAGSAPTNRSLPQEGTKAPWATQQPLGPGMAPTAAPWARPAPVPAPVPAPAAGAMPPPSRAPWASNNSSTPGRNPQMQAPGTGLPPPHSQSDGPTKAPWTDKGSS